MLEYGFGYGSGGTALHSKIFSTPCAGTGGPQIYTGKDMLSAHRGMNISEQEYLEVLDDIMGALEKNGVGEREKQEVLMIGYSLKGEILRV